jgi:type II secretory ATPase GspE/PulE/Tfp pilus assembly ATPase PilB-like protein
MSTLYDDGIRKVLEGITTIDEVFRVAKRTE